MLAPFLVLLCAAVPPQNGGASLEAWLAELERRTAARRAEAAVVWSANGAAWLAGDDGRLAAILAAAPEIQEPILATLEQAVGGGAAASSYPALLGLLGKLMNPAGAERAYRLLPSLPEIAQPHAVRAAVARGGAAVREAARALTRGEPGALRQAAIQSLLLHAPVEETPALALLLAPDEGEPAGLGAVLLELRERPLPGDFALPETVYAAGDAGLQRDLARFLERRPLAAAEGFLVARALDPARPRQERLLFLAAFEAGAQAHRWRDGQRALEQYLAGASRSESSEDVAWVLLRLGSRDAKRYLLAQVEQEAEANPASARAQLALARRQVDVGDHSDAFKNYKKILESLQGTAFERSLEGDDYVWAARAAAGSRRSKEAGQWLEQSGLNPVELAAYRELPEFESFLDKQPFKRLFGL